MKRLSVAVENISSTKKFDHFKTQHHMDFMIIKRTQPPKVCYDDLELLD